MCLFLLLEVFLLPSVLMLDGAFRALQARNTGGTAKLGQVAFDLNTSSVLQGLPEDCKAAVQFTTSDDQTVEADVGVPCDSLKAARQSTIDVCYDRRNPSDVAWHNHSKYPDPNCSDIGYAAACRLVVASVVLLSCLGLSLGVLLFCTLRACCRGSSDADRGRNLELGQGIQIKALSV